MKNNVDYDLLFIIICLGIAFILFLLAITNHFQISQTYCVMHDDYGNCIKKELSYPF